MLLVTQCRPAGGPVVAASAFQDDVGGVLVATDSTVSFYACGGGSGDSGVEQRWQHHCPLSSSRVEYIAPLTDGAFLVIVSSSRVGHGAEPPQIALVAAAPLAGSGPSTGDTVTHFDVLAAAPLEAAEQQHGELRAWRPAFSSVARCSSSGGSGAVLMLAASLRQGTVHLVRAERHGERDWSLSSTETSLCHLLTTEPGAAIVVESAALGPASACLAPGGSLHCTLLYSSIMLGGGARVRHVACLEVQAQDSSLSSCCWFIGNVHPSTSLVAALPGARTLVASACRLLLVQADAPRERVQVAVQLAGRPTCAAALSRHVAVVGDSQGQLVLLDLRHPSTAPVARGLLPAAPSCLAFMAAGQRPDCAAGEAEGAGRAVDEAPSPAAGILFAGSTGGSVFLEVPEAALDAEGSAEAQQEAADPAAWQLASGGGVDRLAASAAPVTFCQLIDCPSGCGDKRLLMCCGTAPFGRLALGRMAAGLRPLAVGGDHLPGLVRLLALQASGTAAARCYLLLSSEDPAADAAGHGWTTVLEATAGGLHAAVLPGLHLEAATLLAAGLPGGHMLQVTPQAVRTFCLSTGALQSCWQPPSGAAISLAAACGQHVAVAYGGEVQVLYCGGGTGQMREERLLRLPQQASALALFQPGQGGCNAGGEVWVAAGLWMSNEVVLQPLSAEQPAARLGLAHHQPRSLAVCQLGGSGGGRHLVAGTSSGEVVWWRLVTRLDASGAVCGVQLEEGGWARAGLAAVSLHALHQPGILAVSDQALLLAAPHPERSPAAARVHGGQGLTAACALPAGSQPQANSLAYIQAGRLHIGCLEPGVQLRWDEAALGGGAAPRAAAYHAASGCAAVACSERGGGSSLRLVDVGAMREVARVPLPPRHTVTALAVAPLPCSSGWQRQASGHGGEAGAGAAAYGQPQAQAQQPGCAQFLLVATAPERGAAPPSHGSGEGSPAAGEERLPLPADSDASQPWWRQQGQQGQQGQQQQGQQGQQGQQDGVPWRPQGSLSVYEVRFRSPPPGDSSTTRAACSGEGSASDSTRWELALHGTCPLPAAALSLAVVHPEAEPLYASPAAAAEDGAATASSSEPAPAAPAAAATQPPLLAAGCDDGAVRLYRVYVDDAGVERRHALESSLAAITVAVPPLHLAGEQAPDAEASVAAGPHQRPAGSAASRPAAPVASAHGSRRLWQGHVALQLVAQAPTAFEGCPTSLAVRGSAVYALDLFSSLTVFRAQPVAAGQLPSLVPLAADPSGRHVSAMLPLSEGKVVAGLQSGGLLLLRRDEEAERHRQDAVRKRWEQLQEQGAAGGTDGSGSGGPPAPTLRDAAPLDVAASYHTPSGFAGMGAGVLGVPLRRVEELYRSEGTSSTTDGADGCQPAPMATLVCTNGTVLSARLLTPAQHQQLVALQRAVLIACEEGGCIDGAKLMAAYLQPDLLQQLEQAFPVALVEQGRDILGLL